MENKKRGVAFILSGNKPTFRNNMFLATLRNMGKNPILFLKEEINRGTDGVSKSESQGMQVFTIKVVGDKGVKKRYEKQLNLVLERMRGAIESIYATDLEQLLFLKGNKLVKSGKYKLFYDATERSVPKKEFKIDLFSMAAGKSLRFVEQRTLKSIGVKGITLDGALSEQRASYELKSSKVATVLTLPAVSQKGNEEELQKVKKSLAGKRVVATMGDYSSQTDLINALEIASNVVSCYDDVFFFFIGETNLDRNSLNNLISDHDLKGRVVFLEGMPYTKMMAYLENSNVGLILDSAGESSDSGFLDSSMRIYSLMQAGLPIVAPSSIAGSSVIVGAGCGMLVKSDSPVDVSSAVTYMLTNPGKAKASGEKGHEAFKSKYCWEKEQQKLAALFGA